MSGKAIKIKYMKRVKMSGVKVMRLVIEAKIFVYLLFTLNYMNGDLSPWSYVGQHEGVVHVQVSGLGGQGLGGRFIAVGLLYSRVINLVYCSFSQFLVGSYIHVHVVCLLPILSNINMV